MISNNVGAHDGNLLGARRLQVVLCDMDHFVRNNDVIRSNTSPDINSISASIATDANSATTPHDSFDLMVL